MPKIVLIENQFREFNKFRLRLDRGSVKIYPDEDQYKYFIDHVRVALNPRYDTLRKPAMSRVIDLIKDFVPDLLIIDHILVGNHTGETGIALALAIREDIDAPIIFLSRTARNDIDVCMNLPKVLPQESVCWVPKGYPGTDFTEDPFFTDQIMPAVATMLGLSAPGKATVAAASAKDQVRDWLVAYMGERKSHSFGTVQSNVGDCRELIALIDNGDFVPGEDFLGLLQAERYNDFGLYKLLHETIPKYRA